MGLSGGPKGKLCLAYVVGCLALTQPIAFLPSSSALPAPSNPQDTPPPLAFESSVFESSTEPDVSLQDDEATQASVGDFLARGDVESAFQVFEATHGQQLLRHRQGRVPSIGERRDLATAPIGLHDLSRILDPGTLLLMYSVESTGVHVFAFDHEQGLLETRSLPLKASELRLDVDRLLESVEGARKEGNLFFNSFRRTAGDLYDQLLRPFESLAESHERILIVPDGPLHRLPFACLVRDGGSAQRGWEYVIEWKPIHMTLSATVYAQLRNERPTPLHRGSFLVAIGDADYGSPKAGALGETDRRRSRPVFPGDAGMDDLPALPETGREVRAAGRRFTNHRLYLGKDATKGNLRALETTIDILHLSVHGQVDDVSTGNTALIFSPQRRGAGKIASSARLEMQEILDGYLPEARLVVLSACNSALGPQVKGEGLKGLSWAFLAAGSRSVVSSLWQVDDQRTADLMDRFYGHLQAETPPAEALRRAQIDLISGPGGETLAPYFWAAFQLHGDWR